MQFRFKIQNSCPLISSMLDDSPRTFACLSHNHASYIHDSPLFPASSSLSFCFSRLLPANYVRGLFDGCLILTRNTRSEGRTAHLRRYPAPLSGRFSLRSLSAVQAAGIVNVKRTLSLTIGHGALNLLSSFPKIPPDSGKPSSARRDAARAVPRRGLMTAASIIWSF